MLICVVLLSLQGFAASPKISMVMKRYSVTRPVLLVIIQKLEREFPQTLSIIDAIKS